LETNDVHFVLGGDFNARIANWFNDVINFEDSMEEDTFCRKTEDSQINIFGKLLVQFCQTFHAQAGGLIIVNCIHVNMSIKFVTCDFL
jgi:hypothetical protein